MWKSLPHFQCLPCAEGCDNCQDERPCTVALNWVLRTILLILQCIIMCCLPIVVLFTYKYQDVKVRRWNTSVKIEITSIGQIFKVIPSFSATLIVSISNECLISEKAYRRELGRYR